MHQIDQIFSQLRRNLLFCAVREVEADVCFKHLGHEAVDAAADSSQEHELVTAILLASERALYGVKLAAQFFHALLQLDPFPILMRHGDTSLDSTHPGYGIYPVGV